MSQPPTETDPEQWHRHFAIAYNNRAWELTVQARGPKEDQEMLNLAHASALHWAEVGTELNKKRATMLLAEVHALLGYGPSAVAYVEEIRGFFLDSETPDWEIAFTHTIDAHAACAAGDSAAHRNAYREAKRALDAIVDPEDRKIVQKTFDQVPAPELP